MGFAIIRKDLLEGIKESVPTMLNYSTHQENNSMYNTPPTFAWYVAGKVFRWLKSLGGLKEISKTNVNKATKLYKFIDQSDLYFNNIDLIQIRSTRFKFFFDALNFFVYIRITY